MLSKRNKKKDKNSFDEKEILYFFLNMMMLIKKLYEWKICHTCLNPANIIYDGKKFKLKSLEYCQYHEPRNLDKGYNIY